MKATKTTLLCMGLFVLLLFGCSARRRIGGPDLGQYIAIVDSFAFFWQQINEDSAFIFKADADGKIDTCRFIGRAFGALAAPEEVDTMPIRGGWLFSVVPKPEQINYYSNRYFFIILGEERYMLFDAKHFPSKMDLLE